MWDIIEKLFDTLTASLLGQVVVYFVAGMTSGWFANEYFLGRPRRAESDRRIAVLDRRMADMRDECERETQALRAHFNTEMEKQEARHHSEIERIHEEFVSLRSLNEALIQGAKSKLFGDGADESDG